MADIKNDANGPPNRAAADSRADKKMTSTRPQGRNDSEDELLRRLKKLGEEVLEEPVPEHLIDVLRERRH